MDRTLPARIASPYVRCSILGVALFATACEYGDVTVYDVPPAATHDITLVFRAEDAAAAELLNWEEGRIPGADVRIVPEDSTANSWRFDGTTDDQGVVALDSIPTGRYVASVTRLLDEGERQAAAEAGAMAFMGSRGFRPESIEISEDILVHTSERGALVITEFAFAVLTEDDRSYTPGGYIELYNNADSTIYLDGKVIARAFGILYDFPNRPCSMFEHLRADSRGIYAAAFEMFPGSGNEYALSAGQTALIAVDAIDHRPFTPHGFDLSGADFEFRGAGDVDNPAVPNMINIGLRQGTPYGLAWPAGSGEVFISNPVDVTSLPTAKEPDSPTEYARFPASGILDVAFFSGPASTYPYCHPAVAVFLREHGDWQPPRSHGMSMQRKTLLTLPDGQAVVQQTRSTAADFFLGSNSPGAITGQQ